jgi:hypothetical protein
MAECNGADAAGRNHFIAPLRLEWRNALAYRALNA